MCFKFKQFENERKINALIEYDNLIICKSLKNHILTNFHEIK